MRGWHPPPPFGTQYSGGGLDGTQYAKGRYAVRRNSVISYAEWANHTENTAAIHAYVDVLSKLAFEPGPLVLGHSDVLGSVRLVPHYVVVRVAAQQNRVQHHDVDRAARRYPEIQLVVKVREVPGIIYKMQFLFGWTWYVEVVEFIPLFVHLSCNIFYRLGAVNYFLLTYLQDILCKS